MPESPPQTSPISSHSPVLDTLTPAAFAIQVLSYVVPSQPQTGAKFWGHAPEIGWQTPVPAAPQAASSGRLQNVPAAHWPESLHWTPALAAATTTASSRSSPPQPLAAS